MDAATRPSCITEGCSAEALPLLCQLFCSRGESTVCAGTLTVSQGSCLQLGMQEVFWGLAMVKLMWQEKACSEWPQRVLRHVAWCQIFSDSPGMLLSASSCCQ